MYSTSYLMSKFDETAGWSVNSELIVSLMSEIKREYLTCEIFCVRKIVHWIAIANCKYAEINLRIIEDTST